MYIHICVFRFLCIYSHIHIYIYVLDVRVFHLLPCCHPLPAGPSAAVPSCGFGQAGVPQHCHRPGRFNRPQDDDWYSQSSSKVIAIESFIYC